MYFFFKGAQTPPMFKIFKNFFKMFKNFFKMFKNFSKMFKNFSKIFKNFSNTPLYVELLLWVLKVFYKFANRL